MTRDQLEHLLRAASDVTGIKNLLVIGSQSILGSFAESMLPAAATGSIEADIANFDSPDETSADQIDGALGEDSRFHEEFGIYAQGVDLTTAVLPDGWQERLVVLENANTRPARGLCLEPHDCATSKLVAWRQKDVNFANALVDADLLNLEILAARIEATPVSGDKKAALGRWLDGARRRRDERNAKRKQH